MGLPFISDRDLTLEPDGLVCVRVDDLQTTARELWAITRTLKWLLSL